jgi:hypothetical protein
VDRAARKVIEDADYGPGYTYFTHRVGHGIGMDGHEWPYLVKGNTVPLEVGNTFSDEPGIYIRGEFVHHAPPKVDRPGRPRSRPELVRGGGRPHRELRWLQGAERRSELASSRWSWREELSEGVEELE